MTDCNYDGANGIDLRAELKAILDDHGHWGILRHRVGSQHSSDLNPSTEEGEDMDNPGSAHKYQDMFIKLRKRTLYAKGENPTPLGKVGEPILKFYVASNVRPAKHDYIIELAQAEDSNGRVSPSLPYAIHRSYNIVDVDDMREEGGKVEFFEVYVSEIALGDFY